MIWKPFAFACLLTAGVLSSAYANDVVDLAGEWRFAIDRSDQGVEQQWFAKDLAERIRLPGSMAERGFGDDISVDTPWTGGTGDRSWYKLDKYAPYREPGNVKVSFWLQPKKYYKGAAWYQRDIKIPADWKDRRVVLFLERPHWETTVWLDGRKIGSQNALGVPHEYELGAEATPGIHRLTIRVDNRVVIPVGDDSHSVTDHTQGNWNGVVGAMRIYSTSPVWIDDLQVFPNAAKERVRVVATLGNQTGKDGQGTIAVLIGQKTLQESEKIPVKWTKEGGKVEFEHDLGPSALLWDEFQPNLYRIRVSVTKARDTKPLAERETVFGLRDVGVQEKQITVNGRRIFLRGTLECCIFPRTGYPPTDVESWRRILTVSRTHGLNHLRFHSWCPPEAAFEAADEMGFYYHVECSAWAWVGDGSPFDRWLYEESQRMVKAYGNHPSFLLMAYGNEPHGKNHPKFLGEFVNFWKARDSRRLYTGGAGWPIIPEDQYHVTPKARAYPVRAKQGDTADDYSRFLEQQSAPVVSHEIGQYCVFPNLDEIKKYTGPLQAKNFEIVRDFMAKAGMADQAADFLRASGKLQTLFYKDEIEACLRTPGWAGFQLLDLHDFPGQGTALVGVLDPFWEEKGYIKPERYRRFCDETVPLARVPKRIFTNDETLQAKIEVAHFGQSDWKDAKAVWRLTDGGGKVAAQGSLAPKTLPTGSVTPLGAIDIDLKAFAKAAALKLEVQMEGSRFANDWNLWVYPAELPHESTNAPRFTLAEAWNDDVQTKLAAGSRVVLFADPRTVRGNTVGRFDPIFWNRLWFPTQPQHTVGLLLAPAHPALAGFPTDFHSDWQWQDLQNHSKPMILDSFPKEFRPTVQAIDDWNTCRKLGLIVEAKVGKGRLLVCSIDLKKDMSDRPAARQLRRSLLDYAASDRFDPKTTVDAEQVKALFRDLTAMEKSGVRVVRTSSEQPGYEGRLAIDGDSATMWHTKWGDNAPKYPHELVLGFDMETSLSGVSLLPRQDNNRNGQIKDYAIYVSRDGKTWGEPVAKGSFKPGAEEQTVTFAKPARGNFLRLVVLSGFDPKNPFASLAEIQIQTP